MGVVESEDPGLVSELAAEPGLDPEPPRGAHLRHADSPPVAAAHQVDAPLGRAVFSQSHSPTVTTSEPSLLFTDYHAEDLAIVRSLRDADFEAVTQSDHGRAVRVETDDTIAIAQSSDPRRTARRQDLSVSGLAQLEVSHEILSSEHGMLF